LNFFFWHFQFRRLFVFTIYTYVLHIILCAQEGPIINYLQVGTPTQRQQNIGICQALWKWTQPVRFTFILHTLKSKPNLYPFHRVYLHPRSTALARLYTQMCMCVCVRVWMWACVCVWVCIRYMQRLQKNVGKVFVPKSSPVLSVCWL